MDYVHGYDGIESQRLAEQAITLAPWLHANSQVSADSVILEAGCGVGAQTLQLAQNNPHSHIIAVDVSESSLDIAKRRIAQAGLINVTFIQSSISQLPLEDASVDYVYVCFVLEHLSKPEQALRELKRCMKTDATIEVIEGDHDSCYFYPPCEAIAHTIACQVELQQRGGGNPNIGKQLYPIMAHAGFKHISVKPQPIYTDPTTPLLAKQFTQNTFAAMLAGIKQSAIAAGIANERLFEQGIENLFSINQRNGVFGYSLFVARASVE